MIEFEEANNKNIYYKIIQTATKYRDNRNFPIDEVVIADRKVNLNAETSEEMGGFFISDYDHIFRWLIRGDTLCEVKIPEGSIIYKTSSKNGIYIADRIILTNPKKLNDDLAMILYENSKLPEESYFRALAACAIKGYSKTIIKVINERVNNQNVVACIEEFNAFCQRREEEYKIDTFNLELVKNTLTTLNNIK
jgi:hypothetical protein